MSIRQSSKLKKSPEVVVHIERTRTLSRVRIIGTTRGDIIQPGTNIRRNPARIGGAPLNLAQGQEQDPSRRVTKATKAPDAIDQLLFFSNGFE